MSKIVILVMMLCGGCSGVVRPRPENASMMDELEQPMPGDGVVADEELLGATGQSTYERYLRSEEPSGSLIGWIGRPSSDSCRGSVALVLNNCTYLFVRIVYGDAVVDIRSLESSLGFLPPQTSAWMCVPVRGEGLSGFGFIKRYDALLEILGEQGRFSLPLALSRNDLEGIRELVIDNDLFLSQ